MVRPAVLGCAVESTRRPVMCRWLAYSGAPVLLEESL
jgi:hypothetical protein